jgi:hypothetical protein
MQKSRIDILNGGSGKQIGADKSEQKIIGRSHAKGGVDVKHASGEDYELEGGEVVDGDRVFSAKLKSSSGETFAVVAESLLKAKKKANDAFKVASSENKIKIRKKIKALEEELTKLFDEQQEQNNNSTGEYAAIGTEMGLEVETPEAQALSGETASVEPVAMDVQQVSEPASIPSDLKEPVSVAGTGNALSSGSGDPIADLYEILKKSNKKNYFNNLEDFRSAFNSDKNGVINGILLQSDLKDQFNVVLKDNFSEKPGQKDLGTKLFEQSTGGKTIGEVVKTTPVKKVKPLTPEEKIREQMGMFSGGETSTGVVKNIEKNIEQNNKAKESEATIEDISKVIGDDYENILSYAKGDGGKLSTDVIRKLSEKGINIDDATTLIKEAAIKARMNKNEEFADVLYSQIEPNEIEIGRSYDRNNGAGYSYLKTGVENTEEFADFVDKTIEGNIKSGKFPAMGDDQKNELRTLIINTYKQKGNLKTAKSRAAQTISDQYVEIGGRVIRKGDIEAEVGTPGLNYDATSIEEILKPVKEKNPSAYEQGLKAWKEGKQISYDADYNLKISDPLKVEEGKAPDFQKQYKEATDEIYNFYKTDVKAKINNLPVTEEYKKASDDLNNRFKAEYDAMYAQLNQAVQSGSLPGDAANAQLQAFANLYDSRSQELYNSYSTQINENSQRVLAASKEELKKKLDSASQKVKADIERYSGLIGREFKGLEDIDKVTAEVRSKAEYYSRNAFENIGIELTRGVYQIMDGISGMSSYLGANEFANFLNDASRQYNAEYLPFNVGEFSFSQLINPDFWITKFTPMIPFVTSLMIPGYGAGRMAMAAVTKLGLTGLTRAAAGGAASALAMRPIESFLEAGFVYKESIDRGLSSEEAAQNAVNVMGGNLKLILSDFLQSTMLFSPAALNRGFSSALGKAGTMIVTEGGEEVYQEYLQKKQFTPGITFFDYATTNEGLEVFTLGAAGGLMFGSLSIMKDILNRPSNYEKFIRNNLLKMIEANSYPELSVSDRISRRTTDLIAQVQVLGARKQITDAEAAKLIKDLEFMGNTLKSLPANISRNEKVAIVEGLVSVKSIEDHIASNPDMDSTIKEGWEKKLKQAKQYVQDMMDSKAQVYMVGPVVMNKEQFLSELDKQDVLKGMSDGSLDTFVQNDPEVSKIMEDKINQYKAKPQEQAKAATAEVKVEAKKPEVDNLPVTGEVDRTNSVAVDEAPGGTFINVGLNIGKTDEQITEEDVTSRLPEDVEVLEMSRIEPDSGTVQEPTLSIKLSRPLTDAEMAFFLEDTQREAVPQVSENSGAMYGSTDYGDFNGYYFVMPDGKRLSNVAPAQEVKTTEEKEAPVAESKEAPTQYKPKKAQYTVDNLQELEAEVAAAKDSFTKKILASAAAVIKATAGVKVKGVKGVRYVIHSTNDSYNESLDEELLEEYAREGRGSAGFYVDSRGVIHINLEYALSNTAYHEGAHPVIEMMLDSDPAVVNKMFKQIKSLSGNASVKELIDWAKSSYKSKESAKKETVVEFIARVADGQIDIASLDKSTFTKVKEIINEFLDLLNLGSIPRLATPDEVISRLSNIADALKTGRELKEEEITKGKKARPRKPNVPGAMMQSVTIMKGKESLKKFGLKPGRNVTRKIGEALEARQREKYGMIDQKDNSPEAKKKISNWMVDEVKYFIDLMGDKSGKGWYGELYQKALDSMAKIFPEMATDQNARDLFTMLVAITSDGQKVMSNFKLASIAYDYYRKNGVLPSTLPGQRVASFESNLNKINDLLKEYDGDIAAIKEKLMEVKSIEEINIDRKKEGLPALSTNWPVIFKAPFAASVFGPKLGMFFANLSGNEAYPTLDRWWSRTFNRYRGTLIPAVKSGVTTKGEAVGLTRFKELLGTPEMTDEEALLAAKSHRDSYEAKGYKNGTDIEKAANTIYKTAFENLNDAPFTKKDRQFMYETISDAVDKLNKQGYDLSIADVQAILWYFEKNLYKTLGVQAKIEGISYQDAANYTFEKWSQAGNEFDYNIKQSEEGQAVEDEDIEESLEEKPEPKQKVKKVEVEEIKEFIDNNDNPKPVKKEKGDFQMPGALTNVNSTTEEIKKLNAKDKELLYNFVKYGDEKTSIYRLSPEEERGREASSPTNGKATFIAEGVHRANAGSSEKKIKQQEELAIENDAKENGYWIDVSEYENQEPHTKGAESSVFVNKDANSVTKIKTNDLHYSTWLNFLDSLAIHNYLDPNAKYVLKGFTNYNGKFSAVLEQPFIKGAKDATRDEIVNDLKNKGFESKGMGVFINKDTKVFLGDLIAGNGNVLSSNGHLFYIDPVIKPHTQDLPFNGKREDIKVSPVNEEAISSLYHKSKDNNTNKEFTSKVEEVVGKSEGVFQKPNKGETLVPKKWKIDTDGKGNFLFYHYGNIKGNNIDPKYFGKNRYTSDQRQNSVSYFYTRSNEQESMVSGDVNVIKVPMEKVYPFNTDPLNFYDQAEANFRKDFPNGAFDAVKQIDYMNPLIQKAGFDMTVAQWETFPLRAETTKALPIDKELTKAYREFGGLELSDMRDKYETDIVNKLSDIANSAGRNSEYVRDKFYAAGGSDANVSKLMKDPKLRSIIGKSLFDKWNSTLPLKSRGQFQGPKKAMEGVTETRTTDAFGNDVGTWKFPGGYLVQEIVDFGEKLYAVFKNNKQIGTTLTLADASSKIKSNAQFQKRYGQTVERLSREAGISDFQLDVIATSTQLEYRPSKFDVANDIAEQLVSNAIGSNSIMGLLDDIKDIESSPDLSAAAKIFILLKVIRQTDALELRAENERAVAILNGISKNAGETLRALQVSAIPESITYSFTRRANDYRDAQLESKGVTGKIADLYEKIKSILDDAINSTLSNDDIKSLIEKAIKNGEVLPLTQSDIDALNDEIADLKAVLFSTINNLKAIESKFPRLAAVPLARVRNANVPSNVRSKYANMTVQQIIDQMALKIMQSGKISWPSFKDAMNSEVMKAAGVAYSDSELRSIYDAARSNQTIIDLLNAKKSAPNNMLSKLLKETEDRIADIAKSHWTKKGFKILDLRAEIEEIFGNSPSARSIADKIIKSFEEKVKNKATDIVARELGSTPVPSKKEMKEAKTVVDRMLEHIYAGENAGVLDTDMFKNLFADKYNFMSLNPEQMGVMRAFADAMAYFPPGSFERKKAMAEAERYVTKLQSGKARYLASIFFTEMFYNNVLSGYSTILRAGKGVLYTSAAEMAVEVILQAITNPKNSYLFNKNGFIFGVGKMLDALQNQGWDQVKQFFRDGVPVTTKYEPVQIGALTKFYRPDTAARLIKENGWLKGGAMIGLTAPYWPVVLAARTVGAVDALIKAPLKEFFASTSAFNELLRQGMDPKEASFFKKMEEVLQRDETQLKQAEEQAKEEYDIMMSRKDELDKAGIKISKNYIKARKYEILDAARDPFIEMYAEDMQVRSRLMGKPMGTLGFGYDRIVGLQRDVPGVTYLMPFVRVPSNAMNEWMSWSPYGIVRSIFGKGAITRARLGGVRSTDTKQEARFLEKKFGSSILSFEKPGIDLSRQRYEGEARERGRDAIKGIIGTSMWLTMMMYALGLDDKEKYDELPFIVTNEGPEGADYITMNGLADANVWRKNSFRIKVGSFDSGWISYLDFPFAAAFAQIGYMMDNKYLSQKTDMDEATAEGIQRYVSSVIPVLTFVKSQSYVQGLLDFAAIFGEGRVGPDISFKGTAAAATKFSTNLTKSFFYPNLFRQSYVTYKSFAKQQERFPERVDDDLSNVPTVFWDNLLYNVPWAEDYIENKQYDRFGQPVSRSLSYNALQDAALDNTAWNIILPKTPMKMMKEWIGSVSEDRAWRLVFQYNIAVPRVKDQEELSFQKNIEFKRRVGQRVYDAINYFADSGNKNAGIPSLADLNDRAAFKEIVDNWFEWHTKVVRREMVGDEGFPMVRTPYKSSNRNVRFFVNNPDPLNQGIFSGTSIDKQNTRSPRSIIFNATNNND